MHGLDAILDGDCVVATFHSIKKMQDKAAELTRINANYSDAEYIREIEGLDGWVCLLQKTIEGTTAFQNEIRFFVVKGDKLWEVSFFRLWGWAASVRRAIISLNT